MAVPILRRISPIIEDNHQGVKGALVFWLHLTSLKEFLGNGGCSSVCVCVCVSIMWVLKILFYSGTHKILLCL